MLAIKILAGVALLLISIGLSIGFLVIWGSCLGTHVTPEPVATEARPGFVESITKGKEWFFSQNPQEAEIVSHDGLRLHAYYLSADSQNTIIMMHGYRSGPAHEFAPMFRFYHELGYNLLVPDQRAHGKSEGKYLSFGILERLDVCRWAEYLNDRYAPKNIFLIGASMGGAAVCMATLLTLPENVRGVIADCPFTDPTAQFTYSMSFHTKVPAPPVLYFCSIWSRLLWHWKLEDVRIDDYSAARLPLLILHGSADPTVPHRMSEMIKEHYGGGLQYELFDDCPHIYAYLKDTPRYQRLVAEFLSKYAE